MASHAFCINNPSSSNRPTARQEQSEQQEKRLWNGNGPIVATEDVSITIRRAIEQELQARDFQLGTDSALVHIAADLTRFYNDHKLVIFRR